MDTTKWTFKNIALPIIIASLLLSNKILNERVVKFNVCESGNEICYSMLSTALILLPIFVLVLIFDGIKFLLSKRASQNIVFAVENMPSKSRISPLRVLVENKNSQNIICKAILIDAFSPDETVRRYLGSKLSWLGNAGSDINEKEIDAKGGKETLQIADIDEKGKLFFMTQDQTKYRGEKSGKYRVIYEIRGKIGGMHFRPIRIDQTFEVVINPATNKQFIKSVTFDKK